MPVIMEMDGEEENHYEQLDFDDADDNMRRYVALAMPSLLTESVGGGLWGRD